MKINEIRKLGKEDLQKKIEEAQLELMKLNAQVATGTAPKSPGQIKELKKTVARIKTVINQK